MPALAVLLGALRIVAPDCPSAEQIVARWSELSAGSPSGEARVTVDQEQLRVVLIDPQGVVRADRALRVSDSCSERATVVAVILAAWNPPPSPAPDAPVITPAAIAVAPVESRPTTLPTPTHRRVDVELAAAFVGTVASSGFASSGTVQLALTRSGSPWWGELSLVGGAPRRIALAGQSAEYARYWASLGALRRFGLPRGLRVDLWADVSLALLYANGIGLPNSHDGFAFDVGLGGGVRLGWRTGVLMPFIAASLVGWLTRQELVLNQVSGGTTIPRIDGLISAGLAIFP